MGKKRHHMCDRRWRGSACPCLASDPHQIEMCEKTNVCKPAHARFSRTCVEVMGDLTFESLTYPHKSYFHILDAKKSISIFTYPPKVCLKKIEIDLC